MSKYNKTNAIDVILTIILVIIAVLVGYKAGHHGLEIDAYNRGYDDGWARGVEVSNIDLYATCEDESIASQYPDGFCQGVDEYLGL